MAPFNTSGRSCPARTRLLRRLRRLTVALCVPPAVLSLQAWNILDPMGSLLEWMIDGAVNSWKWVAGYVLKKSDMDSAMWSAANSGLNKVAGVMAVVAVAAGAYGIVRAAACQDIGAVLGAIARTALAWPITVVCITLCVKGSALASTLTSSILQTWTSHSSKVPSISADALRAITIAPLVIVICICVVAGSLVLILMMAARNFLLIFAVVIAAIPIMLQGWSTMRPLLSKWAGWIVGLILMQPVMALCIWVTCEMMSTANSADDGSLMPTLIAIVGMILSSIFPFILIKQVADFIPGTLGLMRGAAAGQATVGAAAAAATAAISGGLAMGAKLSEAVADNKKNAGATGGETTPQGADPTSAAGDPDFNPSTPDGTDGSSMGHATPAGLPSDDKDGTNVGQEQSQAGQESQADDDRKYSPSASQTLGAVAAGLDAAGMHRAAVSAAALGSMAATGMPNVSMGSNPFHDGPAAGGEGPDGMDQPDGSSPDGPVPTGTTPDGQLDIQAGSTGQSSDESAMPETSAEGQSVPQEAAAAFSGQSDPSSSGRTARTQSGASTTMPSTASGQGSVPSEVASELGVAADSGPASQSSAGAAEPSAQQMDGTSSESAAAATSGSAMSSQDAVPSEIASALGVAGSTPNGAVASSVQNMANDVPAEASAAFGMASAEGSASSAQSGAAVSSSSQNAV
ncbi:hypothetical protein, partial [Bifidobacterium catenulatum]|uniref:hypothetical protein n=3 Tax=Bifidobacterium TaxID=1678 RepID=UPI0012AC087B